jgi:hypothetical protein
MALGMVDKVAARSLLCWHEIGVVNERVWITGLVVETANANLNYCSNGRYSNPESNHLKECVEHMNKQQTLDTLYRMIVHIWCGRTAM